MDCDLGLTDVNLCWYIRQIERIFVDD
ncbi:hypothetical protein TorRG33x02_225410 [Trema orientale]|uniref:Uncharacterized protein n=1 Tax=Trema orientale TaxID=63057 RepID=A0A2P5E7Y9_TREOI|nr:hypothetical protein TorRG33x02_225410 [Trema orientale]